jgi:uncharacterized protein (TIGR03067 family)
MRARLLVALLALFGVTAFAPAPLPRRGRGAQGEITLASFQGTWKVVSFDTVGPGGRRTDVRWFQQVRVESDLWTYVVNGGNSSSYRITIEGARPAALDFITPGGRGVIMAGIIRRQGNRVTILYYSAGPPRPRSFEDPPDNWWLLVLEK